ncbi:VOC family protein [Janibacter sp. GS2]|uniref:VOC family protein n=1 Tax=Janibacter sp. GS2 TaxID=3442646 RepID=UPI003EBCAE58
MSDRPVFHTLALDCADPRTVAGFYVELLGYAVSADSDDDWVTITGPGPRMSFQLAPDHVPPTWPRQEVPQQAHVDFFVTDIVAAHQRVLALGGRAIDPVEPPAPSPARGFRVYADPAGHPFCLCRPTPHAW